MSRPRQLRLLDALRGDEAGPDPLALLHRLGGPAALRVAGRDRSRSRVVVTLLHGNEPSGIRALHAWLRSGAAPATDVLLIAGAVEAALADGGFRHRALPGQPDLNRSFTRRPADATAALASEILEAIDAAQPEAVLDLHNNSGHNPAYGVVPRLGAVERAVVQMFSDLAIVYDLAIGSLIEVTAGRYPTIAVETGRAGDPAADEVAHAGLGRYLAADELAPSGAQLEVLGAPVRVRLRAGVRVAFAGGRRADVDVTVAPDLDRHNFERLPAGARLGWVSDGWPLEARGADGRERSRELFRLDGDVLVTARPLVPVMITTDPEIAVSDCLLYVVSPAPAET